MHQNIKPYTLRSFNRQRGATLHPFKKMFPHCSLIKFTGTPENIKEINGCCFPQTPECDNRKQKQLGHTSNFSVQHS
jgi:hypothetical protein